MVSCGRRSFIHVEMNLRLCVFCTQDMVGKGEVFPVHAMKAYKWTKDLAPFILYLEAGLR